MSHARARSNHDDALTAIGPLRAAGFALHWLKPKSKAPIGDGWSDAPVATAEQLRATHRPGNNLGVRLGEFSAVGGGYLHVLDFDVRKSDLKDEAWAAFAALFPNVDPTNLPCVASGSDGESRHLYLVTDKPFRSKQLAISEGKHRHFDKKKNRDVWSHDWEIELYGTNKQIVVPPSIHPETNKPYRWLRSFDFDMLDLGLVDWPFIPSTDIERLAVVEHSTYEFETREPLTFSVGQMERSLSAINVSELHYNDWIALGQAIHHQTGGSEEGFNLWLEHTKRSSKFTGDNQVREMRRTKWKSFGRYRGKPITMATVVEWAKDARVAALRDAFDEEPDEPETAAAILGGGGTVSPSAAAPKPANDVDPVEVDDILGGGTAPAPAAVLDEIDAIGTAAAESVAPSAGDWMSLLDLSEEGTIKPTLHNVELIVRNDSRLVGLPQLNEFTQETVQRSAPGTQAARRRKSAKPTRQLSGPLWQVRDHINGDLWSDDRDFAVRSILEAPKTQGGYGIKLTDRDLRAAIVLAAVDNGFHPVREYFGGLKWDGVARVEQLFTDYLGAEDAPYSRAVSRLMMLGAVARIFEPGHKADHVVILEGLQGKRKSTFIKILARHWFAELEGDFHDSKQMVELMQGAFILELPELSGFGRADVRSIKAFISRQTDKVRLAYARRAGVFQRQCIFIGSTNDKEYLRDDTGGRRFWPIECRVDRIDTDRLEGNIDQLWAEAVDLYRCMRSAQPCGTLPLYLKEEEASFEALRLQETRRSESAEEVFAGQIAEWLERPVASGSLDVDVRTQVRNETCTAEIWCECLGKELSSLSQQHSQLIGRALRRIEGWEFTGRFAAHGRYGKQRILERGGIEGRLARAGKA